MDIDSEYYIILNRGYSLTVNCRLHPEYANIDRELYFAKVPIKPFNAPVDFIEKIIDDRKPIDHYRFDGGAHIFSKRICDVIKNFNPIKVDFLPANITLGKRVLKTYTDYCLLHIYNIIECMDREKSKWDKRDMYNPEKMPPKMEFGHIYKFGLDENKLNKIPLEQRLIFDMRNVVFTPLFHESIINEMIKINPNFFSVMNLSEWEEDDNWNIIRKKQ
jgi:hypothetical protein